MTEQDAHSLSIANGKAKVLFSGEQGASDVGEAGSPGLMLPAGAAHAS